MFSLGRMLPRLLTVCTKSLPSTTVARTVASFAPPKLISLSQPTFTPIQPNSVLKQCTLSLFNYQSSRDFHAKNSKVNYLDFRHRFRTNGKKLHLLIIRRQKMKKHRRMKFRKKFKAMLQKARIKREIAKEKAFRVELLSMIRLAEKFDPKEYALKKINEINSHPQPKSKQERYEELKELIRVNRYQVDYVKPKHRRADI